MSYGVGQMYSNLKMPPKMEVNPMDKCTIVSIFPKEINSIKATIRPGTFRIAAAKKDSYSLLVVGPSSWWRNMDEDGNLLEIPCNSKQVADAIINDHINGLYGARGAETRPGLFVCLGEYDLKTIGTYKNSAGLTFAQLLAIAQKQQKSYFETLVRMADIAWSRTNGNPLSISDDARIAAEYLGIEKSKAWMGDFVAMVKTNCPGCGALYDPNYPICRECKTVVNKKLAEERGIKIAS